MHRYLRAAAPFIEAGLASVFSPAGFSDGHHAQGVNKAALSSVSSNSYYDDAAGFMGIHLHEQFAEWIFLNQCLYFNKGLYDYVLVLEPTDFLVGNGGQVPDLPALIESQLIHIRANSQTDDKGKGKDSRRSLSATRSAEHLTHTIYTFHFNVLGVLDPQDAFGTWGPADQMWSFGMSLKSNSYHIVPEFILWCIIFLLVMSMI